MRRIRRTNSALADHFYVTGGNAGIYEAATGIAGRATGPASFTQVAAEDGDRLPAEIAADEAAGGSSETS